MGFFNRRRDPISERSKMLEAEIAALEAEIRALGSKTETDGQPRFRSTAYPEGSAGAAGLSAGDQSELVLEPVETRGLSRGGGGGGKAEKDLGVRKYDLGAGWRRLKNHFRGPSASNPKLVSYLAVGSIKGLRPLRYEKRVARNRFIALFLFLLLLLWGIFAIFFRSH